jgi:hypothetical protein
MQQAIFHINLEKNNRLVEHGNAKFVRLGIPPPPLIKKKKKK